MCQYWRQHTCYRRSRKMKKRVNRKLSLTNGRRWSRTTRAIMATDLQSAPLPLTVYPPKLYQGRGIEPLIVLISALFSICPIRWHVFHFATLTQFIDYRILLCRAKTAKSFVGFSRPAKARLHTLLVPLPYRREPPGPSRGSAANPNGGGRFEPLPGKDYKNNYSSTQPHDHCQNFLPTRKWFCGVFPALFPAITIDEFRYPALYSFLSAMRNFLLVNHSSAITRMP